MEAHHTAISCDDDELDISMLLNNQTLIMSDENLAEELQLQEVIISSFLSLQSSAKHTWKISEPSSEKGSKESGESSQSLCEICAERKDNDDIFPLHSCSHTFCKNCISKHVSITIKKRPKAISSDRGAITCPGIDCTTILEIENCRGVLEEDVVATWGEVICESMIPPSRRFYCPYKNCSGLLVKEGGDEEVVKEAECPFCNRLFCVGCNAPWHSGVECVEFMRLKEEREDLMVHDLAKKNKWKRCPYCKFYVERNEGCLHITCRCGFQFCYACGKAWSSTHGGCQ